MHPFQGTQQKTSSTATATATQQLQTACRFFSFTRSSCVQVAKMADDVHAIQIQRRTASVLTNMVVGALCVSLSLASYVCFYRWFMVASGWDGLNALQKRCVARLILSELAKQIFAPLLLTGFRANYTPKALFILRSLIRHANARCPIEYNLVIFAQIAQKKTTILPRRLQMKISISEMLFG